MTDLEGLEKKIKGKLREIVSVSSGNTMLFHFGIKSANTKTLDDYLSEILSFIIPLLEKAREEGIKEVMDWVQSYAVMGSKMPVSNMVGSMAESYGRYLWHTLRDKERE